METVISISTQEYCLSPEQRKRRHDVNAALNQIATFIKLVQDKQCLLNQDVLHSREILSAAQQAVTTLRQHVKNI